ncbi:MAG: hypothetical protein ACK54H_09715 [Phycisphaerales bacterium]
MNPIRVFGFLCLAAAICMIVLIIDAAAEKSIATIFESLWREKWGVVTLVDLYAGFAIVGIWMGCCERSAKRWIPWIIALLLLGNVATLAYIAWRSRKAQTWRDIIMPSLPAANATPA